MTVEAMSPREQELYRMYGYLTTKVLKLEAAEKDSALTDDEAALKLLYGWVKDGSVDLSSFVKLVHVMGVMWDHGSLPIDD